MKLELKQDEVKLVAYTAAWKKEFNRVKQSIILATPIIEERIEHIGSTAIKGILTKPIIDIVVGVDDINHIDQAIFRGLKDIGFLRLRVERSNEIVLAKFTDETYEEKTHFIHLVNYEQKLWRDLLFFRDYLNSNEAKLVEYSNLKEAFVKNEQGGIQAYTDYKEQFVKEIYQLRI